MIGENLEIPVTIMTNIVIQEMIRERVMTGTIQAETITNIRIEGTSLIQTTILVIIQITSIQIKIITIIPIGENPGKK